MKLYAISDLHLGYDENRQALEALPPQADDWLILAGDVGDTLEQFELGIVLAARRFARVVWVPGNHDLWTLPGAAAEPRGEARYLRLVDICRWQGVLTPEDPFPLWEGPGGPAVLAPLFLLYDYSFRPDDVPRERAIAWALETDVLCADECYLHPDPHPTREAWCAARCDAAETRLSQIPPEARAVLINHFPLRRDLARLPACPRFSLWCGTRRTEDWHQRFRAYVVVSGHLHIRSTAWRDRVRFEEVSLGYPHQWKPERGLAAYLREILPGKTGR